MGARGSLTSLTFRLEVVTAATGDAVPTAASGDCSGGAGEVLAGSGDPPIKSLTSLFTSSLSLESGSGDFVRPGVDPRITSWDYGERLTSDIKRNTSDECLTSLSVVSFFFCSRDFRSCSNLARFFSNSAFLSAMALPAIRHMTLG